LEQIAVKRYHAFSYTRAVVAVSARVRLFVRSTAENLARWPGVFPARETVGGDEACEHSF